jgi:hypothetical protein
MSEKSDQQKLIDRLMDHIKFQHEVLSECHELTDPRSKTPLQDMQMIRIKTSVALRALAQSGLMP